MTITVLAKPAARENKVIRVNETTFRVFTVESAEKGRANDAIQTLLAAELGLAPTTLTLVRGKKSRLKRFAVEK
jgi:uncharacterized protein YggU (UPF0235/DUF167 family)